MVFLSTDDTDGHRWRNFGILVFGFFVASCEILVWRVVFLRHELARIFCAVEEMRMRGGTGGVDENRLAGELAAGDA